MSRKNFSNFGGTTGLILHKFKEKNSRRKNPSGQQMETYFLSHKHRVMEISDMRYFHHLPRFQQHHAFIHAAPLRPTIYYQVSIVNEKAANPYSSSISPKTSEYHSKIGFSGQSTHHLGGGPGFLTVKCTILAFGHKFAQITGNDLHTTKFKLYVDGNPKLRYS